MSSGVGALRWLSPAPPVPPSPLPQAHREPCPPHSGAGRGLARWGGQEEEEAAAFAPERRRQICSLPHAVVT